MAIGVQGHFRCSFSASQLGGQTCHYVQDCVVGEISLILEHEVASSAYAYWVLWLPDLTLLGIDGNPEKMHHLIAGTIQL